MKQYREDYTKVQQAETQIRTKNSMFIDTDIQNLMMATTRYRTLLQKDKSHYCYTHKSFVDKKHIIYCDHLNSMGPIDKYVGIIQKGNFKRLPIKFKK